MKTTLDLPVGIMKALKIRAARENRRLMDIISDALRKDLGMDLNQSQRSIRHIKPASAGMPRNLAVGDRLEDMLDTRGHRY